MLKTMLPRIQQKLPQMHLTVFPKTVQKIAERTEDFIQNKVVDSTTETGLRQEVL